MGMHRVHVCRIWQEVGEKRTSGVEPAQISQLLKRTKTNLLWGQEWPISLSVRDCILISGPHAHETLNCAFIFQVTENVWLDWYSPLVSEGELHNMSINRIWYRAQPHYRVQTWIIFLLRSGTFQLWKYVITVSCKRKIFQENRSKKCARTPSSLAL